MNRLRLLATVAVVVCCGCGTEIDAEESGVEMAAALSFEPLDPLRTRDDSAALEPGLAAAQAIDDVRAPGIDDFPAPSADRAIGAIDSRDTRSDLFTVLYSENDVEVGARATGVIHSLHAELGDRVAAGATLARLEDAIEVAAVEAAEAALDLARAEHARAAALAEQGVTTPAEMEQATYRLRAAGARAADAFARLERTRVRAPFAGVVSRRFVRLGESLEEGDPVFRVTALRPLRARVRVPELTARGIARGDGVMLRSLDGREVAGVVSRVAPTVDPASGTVEVVIDVADPLGLQPGAAVAAHLPGS